jgi:hypothetical protein
MLLAEQPPTLVHVLASDVGPAILGALPLGAKRSLRLVSRATRVLVDRGVHAARLAPDGMPSPSKGTPLGELERWPLLRLLDITFMRVGPEGAAALAHAHWPGLRHLRLAYCELGAEGAVELAQAELPLLEGLALTRNSLGPRGAAALAAAAFPSLRALEVAHNELGPRGAEALALARWPDLRLLDVSSNRLGAEGAAALAHANWPLLQASTDSEGKHPCAALPTQPEVRTCSHHLGTGAARQRQPAGRARRDGAGTGAVA